MKKVNELLKEQFGIENVTLKRLEGGPRVRAGYGRSVNFQVDTAQGRKFVYKIYQTEPGLYELLVAENQVLQHLSRQSPVSYPTPIRNLKGEFLSHINDGEQLSRLLTFVEGEYLAEVEHSVGLFCSIGRFLAQMNKTLLDSRYLAIEARQLSWDLQHCLNNREYLRYIETPQQRKLVDYFFQQFSEVVLPEIPNLRRCVIHSDANDWNLVVQDGKVSGIIDFGDIVYSALINELAIAITYSILGKSNPIEWACPIIKGYNEVLSLEEKEVELLYYLVAARLCTSVCNSAYNKTQTTNSEYVTIHEKPAREMLEKWISISPIQATNQFKRITGLKAQVHSDIERDLRRRSRFISKSLLVSYQHPIKMVKAAFQYMYDTSGNTYLDARNNIPHVGHCHPKVVQAAQQQMALLNTNTRYLYDLLNDYAERLLEKFPEPLTKVFFVNSGSAASDLAIRLAYTHTGYKKVVVVKYGYHGNTKTCIDISPHKFEGKGGEGPAPYIVTVPIPDTYRGSYKDDDGGAGRLYAQEVSKILDGNCKKVAAFICEPVVGCAGQVPLPKGYLKDVYSAIRSHGGVCISDEVQTGFGRLGDHFWGFQTQGVVPDIVVLGKPIGNGHPLAAVVTTDEIAHSFENGMEFFSSYGGNPVSCKVGLTVLEVIEEEELQKNALETGKYLKQGLIALEKKFLEIGDVRGLGFFLGVEFVKDRDSLEPFTVLAEYVKNQLRENGILVGIDGPYENVIKIKPPMCFNRNNARQLIDELEIILDAYSNNN